MNGLISTRTHGAIDYAWMSMAASVPRAAGVDEATARLVRSAGTLAGMSAMLTDYEAGILRLVPMRMHLAFDFLMGAALMLSPVFLPQSKRRSAAVPVAFGVVACLTSLLTETKDRKRRATFAPSYELSEAVVDPDLARWPHLRSHLE
jgi:hypothetical protein